MKKEQRLRHLFEKIMELMQSDMSFDEQHDAFLEYLINIDLNIILYGYTGFAYICNFAAFGVMMGASHSRNDEIKFKLTRS